MGYKITFESGHVVNFETEPTQQDIDEVEKQLPKSQSLVDKIPDLAPEVKQPPDDVSPLGQLTHIGKSLVALPETVAAVGSGLTSGMAGSILGGWNSMVSGRGFVPGMHEGAEALTYKPRTDIAQEQSEKINEQLNYVLAPMMGHMTGFGNELPRYFKDNKKPTIDPRHPPTPDTGIKDALYKSAVTNLKSKLNRVKLDEQALEKMVLEGTATPEIHKLIDSNYQYRLKLEADLEHLNDLMGVPKEKTITDKMTIEEKQKKYDDLKSLANSGVKLTDKQIELFDSLGVELERAAKMPQEATLRPLEALKTEEPILPPEPPKTNVLDAFKKTSENDPPGNVNWDRSQEWRSTDTPNADTWRIADEVRSAEFDRMVNENIEAAKEAKSLRDFQAQEPPANRHSFSTKEELHAWLDQQRDNIIKKIQRIQNLLKWAKENQVSEVQLKSRKVTTEDLLATRDNLNRELENLNQRKTKSLYSSEDLDPNLPKKVYEPEGAKYSKESILRRLNGVINKYESILKRIRENIHDYEQGLNPSGGSVFTFKEKEYGIEAAKALEEKFTNSYNRLINSRDKIQKSSRPREEIKAREERNKPSQDLPTIDASLLDVETVTPIVKYDKIGDILIAEKHPIDTFINNPELFDTIPGKDTHVDKALVQQAPGIVETVEAFVKDLGLDADKIYIIEGPKSLIEFHGNSAIIHIDLQTLLTNRDVYMNNPKTRSIVEKLSPQNYAHFVIAKIIAHEFGHFVFTKWLKFDNVTNERFIALIQGFNEWAKKNKIEPISWINSLNRAEYQKYHSYFDEYFAERTADSLIRNSLLDRFSDKRYTIAKQIRSVVDTMTSWLAKQGIKINKFDAIEDLIQDIRNRNAESIKKSGKTLWNKLETEQNDKLILTDQDNTYPFANKTLEQIREKPYGVFDANDNPIPWQNRLGELPDIANFSSKALEAIGNSGPYLARKFFGKTTLAGIFKNNPILQDAHYKIRDAEVKSSTAANRIWYTDISFEAWKGAPLFQRFSKVKAPDAPAMVWKALTNQEAYRLHEVYKQGRENNLSHRESLEQFGQHLTDKEKNAYIVFGKMFDDAHTENLKLETKLGKKDRLQYLPGYYPSVRRGDYFVTINTGEHVIHRQHFNTKVAAEAWIKKVEPEFGNHFELGPLEKVSDGAQHPGTFEMIDVADSYLENKGIDVHDELSNLKQKLATRGGKFGHHNEERFNIAGYKGSELGLTPEELGHSFKQGIRDYVQEFQSQYKSMLIRHEVDPMLNTMDLRDTHPQTHAAIQQMKDSALNIIPNDVKAFDTAIYESSDRVARFFYNLAYPNKLFSPHDPVYKTTQAAAISTFYLFKVLPSLAMSVVQLLNPVIAMRHGAIDNGLLTMGSFAKGMYKLFSGDAELLHSLHEVTQTTDIIEPQFLNTLHLKGENKLLEGLKDWGAMRKPQEACDIISRTMGYAYFYTHYKDIGHTPLKAKTLAMEAIDSNFGAYTRGESAPIFQHLGGIIGEGMRPLQTFGQMTVGNLVADIKRMADNPGQLKSYAPFIMYGLTATLLGGAVTGPIMNMYETLRQSFMKIWPEMGIPSALDLVLKGVLSLDSIVEDKEALAKLTAYGVLSQQTDIDIGASARTTETLPGTMLSILLAVVEGDKAASEIAKELGRLMPVHSNVVHMTSGAYTLGKSTVKDVPKNELKQGITDFSMRGPMKNALMEATGANKTTVMGKDTNMIASGSDSSALMKEGLKEKMAHWMGNMSTEERFRTDQKIEAEFTNKVYNDKIKRMFVLYNQTLKPQYLDKLIELGATDANIKSQLETRAFKALLPADVREVTNNKGKVPNNMSSVRKLEHQGLFNFRR